MRTKAVNFYFKISAVKLLVCMAVVSVFGANIDVPSDNPGILDIDGRPTFTSPSAGSITINFPQQSSSTVPQSMSATFMANSSGEENIFSGDFVAAGADKVEFKIKSELNVAMPVRIMLVLKGKTSGRLWHNDKAIASGQQGAMIQNAIRLSLDSGWTRNDSADLAQIWAQDIKDVDYIGIRLTQPNEAQQTYTISDFVLSGPTLSTPPAELTPFEAALKARFGVTKIEDLTAAQKMQDANGDGMPDFTAIRFENDIVYANSSFFAEIIRDNNSGLLIRWPSVRDSFYTLRRSESLMGGFKNVPDTIRIQATNTGYMTYRDMGATNDCPYFYKVLREYIQ